MRYAAACLSLWEKKKKTESSRDAFLSLLQTVKSSHKSGIIHKTWQPIPLISKSAGCETLNVRLKARFNLKIQFYDDISEPTLQLFLDYTEAQSPFFSAISVIFLHLLKADHIFAVCLDLDSLAEMKGQNAFGYREMPQAYHTGHIRMRTFDLTDTKYGEKNG